MIQRLTPHHAPAYRALMLDAYSKHPHAFTSTPAERSALPLSWWEARVAPGAEATSIILGAFANDALVGVAGLALQTRTKLAHKAKLFGMYVRPQARRTGLGQQLVNAVLSEAKQRGVEVVQLTVSQPNHGARKLYASCGFEYFGTEPLAIRAGDSYVAKLHLWRHV
ncbi:MAG: GNAT family N-acetyltransferase [Rhodothermales bacterium]